MNNEQKRSNTRWHELADKFATASVDEQASLRGKIERATEQAITNLKAKLFQLLAEKPAQDGLRAAIAVVGDVKPMDNATGFPRWRHTKYEFPRAAPDADVTSQQWFDEIDRADDMLRANEPGDAFLHVCETLCRWAGQARTDYELRNKVAESMLKREGPLLSQAREEIMPKLSGLEGSKKAVATLSELGRCSRAEVRRFHAHVDRFIQIADNAFPRAELVRALPQTHVTALGRMLMYVFMRVGFKNETGAFYASALAARHGFALSINTMKAFPLEWKREARLEEGEPPGPSNLS